MKVQEKEHNNNIEVTIQLTANSTSLVIHGWILKVLDL